MFSKVEDAPAVRRGDPAVRGGGDGAGTEIIASSAETPDNLPTVTECRRPDGRVKNVTVSEDFDRLPFRSVVKNADGEIIHEEIVRELGPPKSGGLTPEEEEEVRPILEEHAATHPFAAQLLAEVDGESR